MAGLFQRKSSYGAMLPSKAVIPDILRHYYITFQHFNCNSLLLGNVILAATCRIWMNIGNMVLQALASSMMLS